MSDDGKLWAASKNLPRVNICGCVVKKGDIVEIWLSLRGLPERYEFVGFNPHLFTFNLLELDTGESVLIPYKSIKKIRVIKPKNKGGKSG